MTAVAPPFTGGPALDEIDAAGFSHAFFVCGPFGRGPLEADFLSRFAGCRLVGVNLSLALDPGEWQPFDLVLERDSVRSASPDLVFASANRLPPVVGVCLREAAPTTDVDTANAAIAGLLARRETAQVPIDTRLDVNSTGLRTKSEIEAVISRMDVVVTTRLHGVVMALKHGVPAVAVDSVPGGGKVSSQCRRIGWPNLLRLEDLDDERLDRAFDFALSAPARALALECSERARSDIGELRARLASDLSPVGPVEQRFAERMANETSDEFLARIAPPAGPAPGWRGTARALASVVRGKLQG